MVRIKDMDCLACRRRQATRYINIGGQKLPTCDKCYHDPKMTPRRWQNAKKRWDRLEEAFKGKKCVVCGKPANTFVSTNKEGTIEDNSDYSDRTKWLPTCGECDLK